MNKCYQNKKAFMKNKTKQKHCPKGKRSHPIHTQDTEDMF